MWNKVSYMKKLMEIAIDILGLVLFAYGYNTRLQKTWLTEQKRAKRKPGRFCFSSEL